MPRALRSLRPNLIGDDELVIDMLPRGRVEWLGTIGQLVAEQLIPTDMPWPAAGIARVWTAGRVRHCLMPGAGSPLGQRTGRSGPEWWSLVCQVPLRSGDALAAAYRHALDRALIDEAWQSTPSGLEARRRLVDARLDKAFQAFCAEWLR